MGSQLLNQALMAYDGPAQAAILATAVTEWFECEFALFRAKAGIMSPKEIAELIDGTEYGTPIAPAIVALAKKSNLVIVHGQSDDIMRVQGAVDDEVSCYDGGPAYFSVKGLAENECPNEDCPYHQKELGETAVVTAVWHDNAIYCWTYKTALPHATFEILEGGEPYCLGIVFDLADTIVRSPA